MNAPSENSSHLLETALEYEARGWSILPLRQGDKRPLLPSWADLQHNRANREQIIGWYTDHPLANVGIITGAISGLIVLDVDSSEALEHIKQLGIPKTPAVKTGKGYHFYFAHPGGKLRNFAGKLPGVDLRADGGYVVAPPSLHPSGAVYLWHTDPNTVPLAAPPSWLLQMVIETPLTVVTKPVSTGQTSNYAAVALESELRNVLTSSKGQRNNTLNIAALKLGQLIGGGELQRQEVEGQLLNAAMSIGLSNHEAQKTITSGIEAGLKEPRRVPANERQLAQQKSSIALQVVGSESLSLQPFEHETDLGNARRLVRMHGEDIRFVYKHGTWRIWNGRSWSEDETGEIHRRARLTVQSIYKEAAELPTEKKRTKRAQWAISSESRSKLESMVKLAEAEPGIGIAAKDLDSDQWLLNCTNGTVDLRTGKLRPHNKLDLITKCANAEYDPKAQCPAWLNFLNTIMSGNSDLIKFLQRAIGYSLTGDVSEQCLFFMYGTGKNGKSTYIETLAALFGDYQVKTPTETLMSKAVGRINNDVARLQGSRLVIAAETEEGRRLDESLVKDLTGGDTMTARFLHKEFFEFKPTHKLWIYGNHKPVIKGTDHGIWRRIRLIPFNVVIPEKQRDPQMGEKLLAELPGILAWAVRGCLAWRQDGLNSPEIVNAATDAYRAEMDVLAAWIDECCLIKSSAKAPAKDLYASYTRWCNESGEVPVNQRRWGMSLTERGFTRQRLTSGFWWNGIGIQSQ